MLFTEYVFILFIFLTFFFFFLARNHHKTQIIILLMASYIFYAWWNIKFLSLILFSSFLDFFIGNLIYKTNNKLKRKRYLYISLIGNLGVLGFFKYFNFFIDNIKSILDFIGIHSNIHTLTIILPVGISFYTFQTLSYTLDIYYKRIKPSDSVLEFLLFVAAFPQLVAGPIVRAKELLPQLKSNLFRKINEEGAFYILYGLMKKLLIADILGFYFVDKIFKNPVNYSSIELLLGTYCYAFQIFFDFSAYSDIAIGLGKIFGIDLPINFKYPYSSRNPKEFWQKWHITLSTWLRDYLYIPLGGNKVKSILAVRNLLLVMLLGGLWHGAKWTFIAWGGLHGIYILLYRYFSKIKCVFWEKIPIFLKIFLFFNLLCLAWVFFRSMSLSIAFNYFKTMFSFTPGFHNFNISFAILMLSLSAIAHYLIEPKLALLAKIFGRLNFIFQALAFYLFFTFMSYLGEKNIAHNAFIYFQF